MLRIANASYLNTQQRVMLLHRIRTTTNTYCKRSMCEPGHYYQKKVVKVRNKNQILSNSDTLVI